LDYLAANEREGGSQNFGEKKFDMRTNSEFYLVLTKRKERGGGGGGSVESGEGEVFQGGGQAATKMIIFQYAPCRRRCRNYAVEKRRRR